MKLLSQEDTKSLKQSELARDSIRTESVRKALLDAQTRLDETEAKFDLALAKQQGYMADEEQKHLIRLEALKKEVKDLEERQKAAHFPIAAAERKAYDNLEKSKKTLLESELQKKKNEEIEEKLTEKLDSLSERDEELDRRELKVEKMEVAANDQKIHLQFLTESLSQKWSEFYKTSRDHEEWVKGKEREIELHMRDLDRREDILLVEKENLREAQEKITSARITLQTAFEELRKNKNG